MHYSKITLAALVLITGIQTVYSQPPDYMVYCDQDEFDWMQQNWSEEIEIDCTVVLGDSVFAGSTIRLRGDSSRGYPKKSYRLTTAPGDPIDGRSKWNLNAEYQDHTYMHSWLFARIMDDLGYPCFSIEHARLYVNDEYMGLYVRAEPVDEQFLLDSGLDPQGNLYKAQWDGACLSRYDDVDSLWSKKTNEGEGWNDLYDLVEFFDGVNSDSLHILAAEHLDLNSLLTITAVNTLTSNYSTYYHNYYLYRDIRGSGKWLMLPWDVDKTFGSWVNRSYTQGVNAFWYDNPIFEKLILDPVLFELYFDRMEEIASSVMNQDHLGPLIDSLELALESSVAEDSRDAITIDEFHEEVSTLRDERIPQKIQRLLEQYQDDPRTFRAYQMDETSLGDHFIWWEPSSVLSGGEIEYSVYLTTKIGAPDSIIFQEHFLTDTFYTFTDIPEGSYYWFVEAWGESGRRTESYDHWNPVTVHGSYSTLSGTMSGLTILHASGSPYLVTGDIHVPGDSRLLVEKGVQLRMVSGADILCDGVLESEGTLGMPVVFTADDPSARWGGIRVTGSAEFRCTEFRYSEGYEPSGAEGACLEGRSADMSLDGCSFWNNGRCINIQGGSVLIDSCSVTGWNTGELFFMEEGSCASISNTDFGNMTDPPATWHDAVEFQNCRSGEFNVFNCRIFNIEGDGVDLNSSEVVLENLEIWGISDKGVSVGINTSAGSEPSELHMTGSLVTECYEGISVKDGSHALLEGTTVTSCGTGLRAYEKTSGYIGGYLDVRSVILWANTDDISIEDGSMVTVSYSLTGNGLTPGTGNISTDPLFDPWGGDELILSAASPCIDTGHPGSIDLDGTRSDMGRGFFPQNLQGLALNELQSVNDITISDGFGQYDDWVELYNGTGYDLDLGWIYLSDDPSLPAAHRLPAGLILPDDAFLVVWMDGDWWQGGLHAPWRLSSAGDSLYLSHETAGTGSRTALNTIDSVVFGSIGTDRSYGRVPDGGGSWEILEIPTPGLSNTGGSPSAGYLFVSSPFPNPSRSGYAALDITLDAGLTTVSVYDLAGRLVATVESGYFSPGEHRVYWDTSCDTGVPVPNGVYLINVRHAGGLTESRKVVVLRD